MARLLNLIGVPSAVRRQEFAALAASAAVAALAAVATCHDD
jgi:hypothetical protein